MRPTITKALSACTALALAAVALAPGQASAAPEQTLADILLSDSAEDDADGFDTRPYDFDIVTNAILLFPDLVEAASSPDSTERLGSPGGNCR